MGSRARYTIRSVVSLAAAGAPFLVLSSASCGSCDDDDQRPFVFPTEGSTFDVPAREKDAAVQPDAEDPNPKPDAEAGACTVTGTPIDVIHIEQDPPAFGGVVADGTYALTGALYADGKDGGVAFKRAGQMVFAGKNVTWQFSTYPDGGPSPTCCEGTWAYNATEIMQMNLTCNGEPELGGEYYDFFPNGIPDGGTDAAQLMIHVSSELHDIYTKK